MVARPMARRARGQGKTTRRCAGPDRSFIFSAGPGAKSGFDCPGLPLLPSGTKRCLRGVERPCGPARAQPRSRFDVSGNRPEPRDVRVCRRVSLINATDGLAIIEDDPVLKVGRRRGAFEISRSQRESHGPERLRVSPGDSPRPPGYSRTPPTRCANHHVGLWPTEAGTYASH
jgi:hypothetical protein